MTPQTKKIAVFASGTGTNAENIIHYFKNHPVIEVGLVVCNKQGAEVLTIAEKNNVPFILIEKEQFFRGDAYVPELKKAGISLIVLAGFLWKIPSLLIAAYPEKIINIHPALLPKFGGKGMYGLRVHEAVLAAGEKESGITIHLVDDIYDNGKIIFQKHLLVSTDDTPETLAKRIHELEYRYFPEVIEEYINTNL